MILYEEIRSGKKLLEMVPDICKNSVTVMKCDRFKMEVTLYQGLAPFLFAVIRFTKRQ